MTHDPSAHVGALLDRYRTGELPPAERERLAAHLAECEACAGELAALQSFSATVARGLAASRSAPDPAGRRRAVLNRIAELERARGRGRLGGLPRWAPQALAAVVGAIAVGVVLRTGVWPPGGREDAAVQQRPVTVAEDETSGDRTADGRVTEERDRTPELEMLRKEAEQPRGAEDARRAVAAPAAGARREDGRDAADELGAAAPPPEGAARTTAPPGDADRAAAGEAGAGAPETERRRQAAVREEPPAEPSAVETREENFAGAAPAAAAPETKADGAAPAAQRVEAAVARSEGERLLSVFEDRARAAIAARDARAGGAALAMWADSVADRDDVPPAGLESGRALADSLEDLVASAGDRPD